MLGIWPVMIQLVLHFPIPLLSLCTQLSWKGTPENKGQVEKLGYQSPTIYLTDFTVFLFHVISYSWTFMSFKIIFIFPGVRRVPGKLAFNKCLLSRKLKQQNKVEFKSTWSLCSIYLQKPSKTQKIHIQCQPSEKNCIFYEVLSKSAWSIFYMASSYSDCFKNRIYHLYKVHGLS